MLLNDRQRMQTYAVRYDANGFAEAITCNGVDMLKLATGAERNRGNAEKIAGLLKTMTEINSLNDLPRAWAADWTLESLHFECRRRGLTWAVLPDTVAEYQRRLVAIIAIEADAHLRRQSMATQTERDD